MRSVSGGEKMSVVWTRGKGCAELASIIGSQSAQRILGDVADGCVAARADLLVARRIPGSFDLVNVAVPVDFEADNVTAVVSAVAGGPHSVYAARTAALIAERLGVDVEMVSASRPEDDRARAGMVLETVAEEVGGIPGRVVDVDGIAELSAGLEDGVLLVLGAPGGSWIQRSLLGPGARLRSKAQAGLVIVRSAPDRVYRWMGEPRFVAPLHQANDTIRLHQDSVLAVAEGGRLIGLVRRSALAQAGSHPVEAVMEDPISTRMDDTLVEAGRLMPVFVEAPIPVTDHDEHLVGSLTLPVN